MQRAFQNASHVIIEPDGGVHLGRPCVLTTEPTVVSSIAKKTIASGDRTPTWLISNFRVHLRAIDANRRDERRKTAYARVRCWPGWGSGPTEAPCVRAARPTG